MSILQSILNELKPQNVQLVAVSKTKPNSAILKIYEQGQRVFGENRVQELVEKQATLPKDIEWHLIGHLQTNKVKYIASFVSMIHAVDSFKLLKEINKQAAKHNRVIDCLLQFKIAEEHTKHGQTIGDAILMIYSDAYVALENVRIVGVMGMATFTDDKNQVRNEFINLKNIFDALKKSAFKGNPDFKEISMGMSGDYQIAIEEGSTMVRIGSLIFGYR